MAGNAVFAPRYANAFATVAASAKLDLTTARQQMADFAGTLDGSPQLKDFLSNPSVDAEQKLQVLDAVTERIGMYREVRNFLAVIMDHDRLHELPAILTEYDKVADVNAGLADVEVTSAFDLNPDDRQQLEFEISKMAVSRLRVVYKQDASLIGGAVVKIGSTVYDGSVRGQLNELKQTLMS